MLTNIRVNPSSNAPEEYLETGSVYFLASEIQVLSAFAGILASLFAPQILPEIVLLDSSRSVEEEFQHILGRFSTRYVPFSIHIMSSTMTGKSRAVFWHEYAHFLWESLNIWQRKEWNVMREVLERTASFETAQTLDIFVGYQYFTLPKEMWARLIGQYFLLQTNDTKGWIELASEPEGFWLEDDIASVGSIITELFVNLGFQIES